MNPLVHAHALELGAKEFLELIGLDGKTFWLKQADVFDAVCHDLRRRPVLEIGLAVQVAPGIPSQSNEGRVVSAFGILAFARVESQRLDLQAFWPFLKPEARIIEVRGVPFALLGVDVIAPEKPVPKNSLDPTLTGENNWTQK